MLVEVLLCFVKQTLLHGVEQLRNLFGQLRERNGGLLAVIAPYCHAHAVFNVTRAELDTQGNSLHLVLRTLPAKAVVAEVYLNTDAGCLESFIQLGCLFGDALLVLRDGNDDDLYRSYARGQNETVIITVGHDYAADNAGGHAPGSLMRMLLLVLAVGEGDVKLLGKARAEVVARAGLERLMVVHHALDGVGINGASELFLIGLVAADNGHGEVVFAQVCVDLKLTKRLFTRLGLGLMQGVPLLPEELSAAKEGAGGFLPAEHGAPLVVQHRKIAPGVHRVTPVIAEKRLGGRANAQPLRQLLRAADGDPCAFGGKALDVILFLLKQTLGDEHGHGDVLVPAVLEHAVKLLLYILPNGVAVWTQDEKPLNAGVIDELRLCAHIGEPLGEVLLHIGYLFNFFILSHYNISLIINNQTILSKEAELVNRYKKS